MDVNGISRFPGDNKEKTGFLTGQSSFIYEGHLESKERFAIKKYV